MTRWYASHYYGRVEGPGTIPYYCDPRRVGAFAVRQQDLAAGNEEAVHGAVVTMAMFQSRRDVDVMNIQRTMRRADAIAMTRPARLGEAIGSSRCECLASAARFDAECDVFRASSTHTASCGWRPRTPCHVKRASLAIGRMGDMGKLATSALLHVREAGGYRRLVQRAVAATSTAAEAADAMVGSLAKIHRIGVKLATMIVSALSTPALAPGATPWWPHLDSYSLVVVDANVSRVIDLLRPAGPRTYAAYADWFREQASAIRLDAICGEWPRSAPRIVQQAVYRFASRANRAEDGDPCSAGATTCDACLPEICPFAGRLHTHHHLRGKDGHGRTA